MRWFGLLLVGLLGCRGESGASGLWAAGISAGLAAVSSLPALANDYGRGAPQCPESCPPEYACNRFTGLCDRAPCGGHCGPTQSCAVSGLLETCVEMPYVLPNTDLNTLDLSNLFLQFSRLKKR